MWEINVICSHDLHVQGEQFTLITPQVICPMFTVYYHLFPFKACIYTHDLKKKKN